MAKKKTDPVHLAAGYSAGKKEIRLRKTRAKVRQKTKGINKVTGKRKNPNSAINKIRRSRVAHLTRKIKKQDMVPGRDVPLPPTR
tara:strand:+ start:743 stop:997 length:255 start_codon:yes stop_codon:yes gene_type:complete